MLLQSLLRPVLTPLMRGMFDAPIASSSAWSPLALWPDGIATPGMWISPRDLTSEWQDYTGTTPVAPPGTVADSSNPVGLALDIRAGATVLTDPGNHMLQATSVDRPLLSARVNLLTYTEDFSDAVWQKGALTVSGQTITATAGAEVHYLDTAVQVSIASGVPSTFQFKIKYVNHTWVALTIANTTIAYFNLLTGLFGTTTGYTATKTLQSDGFYLLTLTASVTAADCFIGFAASDGVVTYAAAGTEQFLYKEPQLNLGSTALPYQRVTSASDYDATDFPIAQLYNGTNSGMATAAFAAGTLIDGMDCMIAVRRDSAAATYLISNTGSRGFFEWESGDTNRPDVSAGTPTYYVDGVACTATRGALFTALTAGDWHILEARGLDLSTWLKVEVSSLASYRLNGPRGDILLYPSTDPTEDKDAARQWLADYYGVTLP